MSDPTELVRRIQQAALNAEAARAADPRSELSARYGQLWDTAELQRDFTVRSFLAPYVHVVRKADGVEGSMMFSHSPRFYHSFSPV